MRSEFGLRRSRLKELYFTKCHAPQRRLRFFDQSLPCPNVDVAYFDVRREEFVSVTPKSRKFYTEHRTLRVVRANETNRKVVRRRRYTVVRSCRKR